MSCQEFECLAKTCCRMRTELTKTTCKSNACMQARACAIEDDEPYHIPPNVPRTERRESVKLR